MVPLPGGIATSISFCSRWKYQFASRANVDTSEFDRLGDMINPACGRVRTEWASRQRWAGFPVFSGHEITMWRKREAPRYVAPRPAAGQRP